MTVEFTLPDIGEGLHEAEIVRWLVAEGDEINRNQPFVEILTDKSNVEMPAPAAGVVARLGADEGQLVQVGELLIVIEDRGSSDPSPPDGADAASPAPGTQPETAPGTQPETAPGTQPAVEHGSAARAGGGAGKRPKASPATRKLAVELGVDLTTVPGTGPGGRILADDVRAWAEDDLEPEPAAPPATPPPTPASRPTPAAAPGGLGWMEVGTHPLRGIRRSTARAMDRSWSTIPHISASREIDATPLLAARAELRDLQGDDGPPITPLALVTLAVARALRRYPVIGASLDLDGETITVPDHVGIGIAVATDRGLVVPVVADADRHGVAGLAAEIHRLSTAARDHALTPSDTTGGTHTITNYGSAGGHLATPIIRPGETAITGLGGIEPRPIVVDGEVVARPTLPVVVCADHRLIDGDVMSAFHGDLCRSLSAPVGLLL